MGPKEWDKPEEKPEEQGGQKKQEGTKGGQGKPEPGRERQQKQSDTTRIERKPEMGDEEKDEKGEVA